jgi:hypothetical protein
MNALSCIGAYSLLQQHQFAQPSQLPTGTGRSVPAETAEHHCNRCTRLDNVRSAEVAHEKRTKDTADNFLCHG